VDYFPLSKYFRLSGHILSMNSFNNNPDEEKICPFLGLPFDWQTAMDYPSQQNYCRRKRPASAPNEAHQREYCLNTSYRQCQLFAGDSPAKVADETAKPRGKIPTPAWAILALFALFVVLLALWQITSRVLPVIGNFQGNTKPAGLAQSKAAFVPPTPSIPTLEPATTTTPQIAPIIEITAEPTDTPAPPHLFETPFSAEGRFLLHRVSSGEDLIAIAARYNTTVEAVRAVNYNMPQELWVDTVIIIPVDQTDLSSALPMTALEITFDGLTMENLALQQGINPDELTALNNRPVDYLLSVGEWVVVPHKQPTP
jgi:hypothetical protein